MGKRVFADIARTVRRPFKAVIVNHNQLIVHGMDINFYPVSPHDNRFFNGEKGIFRFVARCPPVGETDKSIHKKPAFPEPYASWYTIPILPRLAVTDKDKFLLTRFVEVGYAVGIENRNAASPDRRVGKSSVYLSSVVVHCPDSVGQEMVPFLYSE